MEENHHQRILLVNDNSRALKLLDLRLSERGYQTFTAESVKDAVVTAIIVKPHLVISELHLRELNGLELRRILGSIEAMSRVPLILLSTEKELPPEFAKESGPPVRNLQKPYTFEELLRHITAISAQGASGAPPGGSIGTPAHRIDPETRASKAEAAGEEQSGAMDFDDLEKTISAELEHPSEVASAEDVMAAPIPDPASDREEMEFLKELVARGILKAKEG